MRHKLNCIVCGFEMDNVMEDKGHQPIGGLSFHTYGHYGSSFFDPMDGSAILIAACDRCLQAADDSGWVAHAKDKNPDYSIDGQADEFLDNEDVVIDWIDGYCPVQAEGKIAGKPFYFRSRGSRWSVEVGDKVHNDDTTWEYEWRHEEKYGDDGYSAGWMEHGEVRRFVKRAAELYMKEVSYGGDD